MVTDLVCRMELNESEPDILSFQHKDSKYFFCTELCRVQFRADPEKYIREAKAEKVVRHHKGLGNKNSKT